MSNIPSSAMPHAGPQSEGSQENNSQGSEGKKSVSQRAGKIADKARENPKTAIAAGAAVVAGVVAAAAIPIVRGRRKAAGSGTSGDANDSSANKNSGGDKSNNS